MRFSRMFATVTAGVAFAMTVVPTPAAAATEKNGLLEPGEIGFYPGTSFTLVFDLVNADPDFSDDLFPGTPMPVTDIRRFRNRDTRWWFAFTGPNYTGTRGCLPPNHTGNLSPTQPSIRSAAPSPTSC